MLAPEHPERVYQLHTVFGPMRSQQKTNHQQHIPPLRAISGRGWNRFPTSFIGERTAKEREPQPKTPHCIRGPPWVGIVDGHKSFNLCANKAARLGWGWWLPTGVSVCV